MTIWHPPDLWRGFGFRVMMGLDSAHSETAQNSYWSQPQEGKYQLGSSLR